MACLGFIYGASFAMNVIGWSIEHRSLLSQRVLSKMHLTALTTRYVWCRACSPTRGVSCRKPPKAYINETRPTERLGASLIFTYYGFLKTFFLGTGKVTTWARRHISQGTDKIKDMSVSVKDLERAQNAAAKATRNIRAELKESAPFIRFLSILGAKRKEWWFLRLYIGLLSAHLYYQQYYA